jgi:hypothetical protein
MEKTNAKPLVELRRLKGWQMLWRPLPDCCVSVALLYLKDEFLKCQNPLTIYFREK